ncbi:MAG: hypothetical protein IPO60_09585 [Flavobacteriales bacterium]|nr:hypothetical protein [Flavobacteriales bacterium]
MVIPVLHEGTVVASMFWVALTPIYLGHEGVVAATGADDADDETGHGADHGPR